MSKSSGQLLKIRSISIVAIVIFVLLLGIAINYRAFYNIDLFKHTSKTNIQAEIADQGLINPIGYSNEQTPILQGCEVSSANQNCIAEAKENSLPVIDEKTPQISSINNSKTVDTSHSPISLNDYLEYLLNINILVINFLQDKEYQYYIEQLSKNEIIEFPPEIKNILTDLLNYNKNYLLNNNSKAEKIFPNASFSWLEKFIKITKKHPGDEDKKILRKKIIKKLDFFINFFYSPKLQQKFIDKNHG